MKKIFYEKLLPKQGVYCVARIKEEELRHSFAHTLDEVFELIAKFKAMNGWDVYVAPNSFKDHSRMGDNAAYSRSLFLDLDVGADNPAKKYPSKAAALDALFEFVEAHDMPPPDVVDSGTGVHAYWILDEELPIDEWFVLAMKLKLYVMRNGLKIDPAITADAARIMRAIDTLNYKTNPPSTSCHLLGDLEAYSVEWFEEFLRDIVLTRISSKKAPLGLEPEPLEGDMAVMFPAKEANFQELIDLSMSGKGCAQIKFMRENRATLSYDLWTAGLTIANRCVDKETAIHEISIDHPEYNYDYTVNKANANWGAPRTCKWFEYENPTLCEGCPHKGKIPTPIALVERKKVDAYVEEITEEDTIRLEENPEEIPVFPKALAPFARAEGGGVVYQQKGKKGKDGEEDEPAEDILILKYDLFPLKRVSNGPYGEALIMRQIKPKDGVKEFTLPTKFLVSFTDLARELGMVGEAINNIKILKLVSDYLIRWSHYYSYREKADIMRGQLGWSEDFDAFIVGKQEITATEDRVATISPLIKQTASWVKPVGDYDVWKKAISTFNEPDFEIHAFGFLCGFGSPLMRFTTVPGSSVAFISNKTGHGKSATLYSALSIWGQPTELSQVHGNGTEMAFQQRFMTMKNLPMGYDEVGDVEPKAIADLLHKTSQGKGKSRMQSSVNAERELPVSASAIAILTSNRDLRDKLGMGNKRADGENARLMQFTLRKPKIWQKDGGLGSIQINPIQTNYGWAGPDFVRYLMRKLDARKIKTIIDHWGGKFAKDFSRDTAYRFYGSTVMASFTGGVIMSDANISDFDLDRIYYQVMGDLHAARENVERKGNDFNFMELVGEFQNQNISRFLSMDGSRVVIEPRGELVGRIEKDNGIFVIKNVFNEFLLKRGVSTEEFYRAVQPSGIQFVKKRMASGFTVSNSVHAVHFPNEFLQELGKDTEQNAE